MISFFLFIHCFFCVIILIYEIVTVFISIYLITSSMENSNKKPAQPITEIIIQIELYSPSRNILNVYFQYE